MMQRVKTGLVTLGLTIVPAVVFAADAVPGTQKVTINTPSDLIAIVTKVSDWFQLIIFAIAIVMLLIAAFQFVTAGGNEEKVSSARKTMIWGLVGLAVAMAAFAAKNFVAGLVGAK